jgi:hypothetical protein
MKLKSTLRTTALACAVALPALVLHSQTCFYNWGDQFGGTGYDYGSSMVIDNLGNVYTTGMFRNTADFDPGSGTSNHVSNGAEDCFVMKTDANGTLVWAVSVGSTGQDIGNEIAIDANGYVYVVGSYTGTVDFNPGAGTSNLTSQTGTSSFILKLTPSGNFDWARSIGSNLGTTGEGLSVDALGNAHMAGNFSGTGDLDPGAGTVTAITTGNIDIYLIELDSAGIYQWGIDFGGSSVDGCAAIAQDVNGDIYMTGYFSGACDFDPTGGTTTLTASGVDAFVTKYSTTGGLTWAKQLGGSGTDGGADITVDFTGNIYTTGYFDGTADFDPGAGTHTFTAGTGISDAFVSCLTSAGAYSWAAQMGGTSVDAGQAISLDLSGNVYTTGRFSGTADFDPSATTNSLTSAGTYDIYISKLSSTGTFVWVSRMGGSNNDVGNAVGTDASDRVYVTGYFAGTCDFDPQAATSVPFTSTGQDDMFLVQLSQSGVGIGEYSEVNFIQAFPNPTEGIITVTRPHADGPGTIRVFNISGEVLLTEEISGLAQQLDLSGYPEGSYFIEILDGHGVLHTQVIR